MDNLVSTEWLSQHLDDPDMVLLDCNVRTVMEDGGGLHNESGRADYEQAHIPSAGFADLKGELTDSNSPIEFAVPTPDQFCSAMGALGVGDDSRVVLYEASLSGWAARVWWMLRWVGFDRAALLDGGLSAWTSEGRALSSEPVVRSAKHLTPLPRPELIANRDEVLASINDDTVSLIDTMPELYYRGEATLYERPGHIPGAVNKCALDLLDDSGHYRPDEELNALFDGNHNTRTITYCGGGIMASSSAFALTRVGYNNVAVYTASLQEWAANPANPLLVSTSPA